MHGFFPGAFVWPALFFFGLLKIVLFVLLVTLIVRLVSHGHRHAAYAHGYGHGFGHGHGHGYGRDNEYDYNPQNLDPRRVAAWRYAAGKIDRAEFDRVIAGLDAAAPSTPPSNPAPPVA